MFIYKYSDCLTSSLCCTMKTAQYTWRYLIYEVKTAHYTSLYLLYKLKTAHYTSLYLISNSKRPNIHRFTLSTNSKRPTTHRFTCPVRLMPARHTHRHIQNTVSPQCTQRFTARPFLSMLSSRLFPRYPIQLCTIPATCPAHGNHLPALHYSPNNTLTCTNISAIPT